MVIRFVVGRIECSRRTRNDRDQKAPVNISEYAVAGLIGVNKKLEEMFDECLMKGRAKYIGVLGADSRHELGALAESFSRVATLKMRQL
jgi:hypothetical protein